jgi:hypothetical protein
LASINEYFSSQTADILGRVFHFGRRPFSRYWIVRMVGLLLLVPVINLIVWAYLLFAPSAVRKEELLLNHLPHPSTAHAAQKYSRRCRHSAARVLGFLQA